MLGRASLPYLTMSTPQLNALTTDPHPQVDLYVNESDISFLKIILEVAYLELSILNHISIICLLLQAPDEANCPYRNGTFLLTCDIPQNYPRDPPEVRFVTFILHPNVSDRNEAYICMLTLSPKCLRFQNKERLLFSHFRTACVSI
jgi:hypothetical protein